jgi:hypothetical protein
VWGEHDAPKGWLTGVGVEVPEDQRTLTSPDREDLDDERVICSEFLGQ